VSSHPGHQAHALSAGRGANSRPAAGLMNSRQDRLARMQLAALPDAAFWARRLTRDVLSEWQISTDVIETAELLVSEIVTNAQKFSSTTLGQSQTISPGDVELISLLLLNFPDRIVVEVSDSNASPPVPTEPSQDSESGYGLLLVKALSKEWGYFLRPSGGKTVYCSIAMAEAMHPYVRQADRSRNTELRWR
jgi:anti-sigma regulatory factor (Ser/Thr protein kinase)